MGINQYTNESRIWRISRSSLQDRLDLATDASEQVNLGVLRLPTKSPRAGADSHSVGTEKKVAHVLGTVAVSS